MPRFFVRASQIEDGTVTIFGDDAHHISRALRMAVGEQIVVCDMQKREYLCELKAFLPDRVCAGVLSVSPSDTEPPYHVHIFQALPKGDKLDAVIQKAVECGMTELTTFESERCVVRMKDNAEEKKLERRQRIALEAAKQSGRGIVPEIHATVSFREALETARGADIPLFCYEGDDTEPLPDVLRKWKAEHAKDYAKEGKMPTVSVVVGSEGGFSLEEARTAREMGLYPVGLGKRILRTETAAPFVLACLVYEMELSVRV